MNSTWHWPRYFCFGYVSQSQDEGLSQVELSLSACNTKQSQSWGSHGSLANPSKATALLQEAARTARRDSASAQPSFRVSPALTARNTHISVSLSLSLVPSGLISFPIFPPRRNRYIENHLFPPIYPVFLLLRNSTEAWVFSATLFASCRVFTPLFVFQSRFQLPG